MSIANRIQEINDHLIDDYKVLRLAGADLTGVNKNIVNLKMSWKERLLYFMNNGLEVVWENWDKVSGTGTSITLNNTEEAPMSLTYKGNTLQNGTPTPSSPIPVQVVSGDNSIEVKGKNFINLNNFTPATPETTITQIENGINVKNATYGYAGKIVINNLSVNTDCYLSYIWKNISNGTNRVVVFAGTTTTTALKTIVNANGGVFNTGNNTTINIWFYATSGTIGEVEYTNIQLEKGNEATTYEEYKSASYPITLPEGMFLGSIGTYQDKIDKSSGKNVFSSNTWRKVYTGNGYPVPNTSVDIAITSSDTNNISFNIGQTYAGVESDFIPVKANEEYTLSFKQATNINRLFVTQYDSNKNRIGTINTNITIIEGKTFTTTNDGYIAVAFTSTSAVNNVVISLVQIEKGNTATSYEPYGTGWYLKKEIGKVVLDGSETNWYITATHRFYTNINDLKTALGGEGLCNSYVRKTTLANENGIVFGWNNQYMYIYDSSYDDVNNWRTNLASNNVTAYYILSTPIYETITDTTLINQLEAIKKSVEGQTNISQVNDGLPFELSVSALGEM